MKFLTNYTGGKLADIIYMNPNIVARYLRVIPIDSVNFKVTNFVHEWYYTTVIVSILKEIEIHLPLHTVA